jgi:hypothetical protein
LGFTWQNYRHNSRVHRTLPGQNIASFLFLIVLLPVYKNINNKPGGLDGLRGFGMM